MSLKMRLFDWKNVIARVEIFPYTIIGISETQLCRSEEVSNISFDFDEKSLYLWIYLTVT